VDLAAPAVIGIETIEGDNPAPEWFETVLDRLKQDVPAIDLRTKWIGDDIVVPEEQTVDHVNRLREISAAEPAALRIEQDGDLDDIRVGHPEFCLKRPAHSVDLPLDVLLRRRQAFVPQGFGDGPFELTGLVAVALCAPV
jgi:hypothetical protein